MENFDLDEILEGKELVISYYVPNEQILYMNGKVIMSPEVHHRIAVVMKKKKQFDEEMDSILNNNF